MTTEDLLLLADQYRDSGSPAARSVLAAKLDALCAERDAANALLRECKLARLKAEADAWRANARDSGVEARKFKAELASANRECEVRNERELGYLARAQSAEAELAQAKNALLRDTRAAVVVLRNMLAIASLRGGVDTADNMLARIDAHLGGEHG